MLCTQWKSNKLKINNDYNSVTINNDHLVIIIFLAIIIIYVNNLALMCKAEEKQMEGLSKYLYV